ncbi:5-methylcytosine restriction system specificity protein McrC, partial [Bacillus velezensis]
NNIIKSTCISLIGNNDIGLEKRKKIKRYMAYFNEAECIDLNQINWNKIKFSRNNLIYKMIIDICFLLNNGLIVNEEDGKYKFTAYLKDRQMAKLYEKFIYEFYKKECPHLKVKYQETIRWKSEDGNIGMLPNMSTDIS